MLKYCDKDGIEKTIIDNENINDYVSGSGKGFSDFFHNNDLKIINDNGDIEIGESSDVNTHVTRITNDCNMAFELTVNGDMGVGGSIDIEGDMSVGGNINQIGPLANLTTDAKSNLVSAINEVNAKCGSGSGSGVSDEWKSSIESSISSHGNSINSLNNKINSLNNTVNSHGNSINSLNNSVNGLNGRQNIRVSLSGSTLYINW